MKRVLLIITVILCVALASCAQPVSTTPNETVNTTANNSSFPPMNSPAPPQPIGFSTIEDAMDFIRSPNYSDYKGYKDNWISTYQAMVASFISDGYITNVSHSTAKQHNDRVTLYPEAKFEDIGICFWFDYNEVPYQVIIRNTKDGDDYLLDLQTEDILDYNIKRFSLQEDLVGEYLNTGHALMHTMLLGTFNYTSLTASCMIDETHYIVIRAEVDQDAMRSFIEGLQIDKIYFSS